MIETQLFESSIHYGIKIAGVLLEVSAILHILIKKNNNRAALGWLGFVIIFPFLGAILYYIFGINRIHRKALKQRLNYKNEYPSLPTRHLKNLSKLDIFKTAQSLGPFYPTGKNNIIPLYDGDQCYDAMFKSIDEAKFSIYLMTYIFDNDYIGNLFVKKLSEAKKRGVEVKVLVDDIGSKGHLDIFSELETNQIDCLRFNTLNLFIKAPYVNLRNHRKLLLVDQQTIYTGGLNISDRYSKIKTGDNFVRDIHFKITGESFEQFLYIFFDDWNFSKGEKVGPALPYPEELSIDNTEDLLQVIPDGPGKTSMRLRWHFIAAINSSSKEILILTPYFLPDEGIITSLISARLRGIQIKIIIPESSDHFITGQATIANLSPLLEHDCQVYQTPGPFNHSKLFIIDNDLVLAGSSNWDDRSLRLNFELNFEYLSQDFNSKMRSYFNKYLIQSEIYTLKDYENRSFFKKIIQGLARLATPYL